MLACLVVMTFGMFMATTAQNVTTLSIWRALTGLGIGWMPLRQMPSPLNFPTPFAAAYVLR